MNEKELLDAGLQVGANLVNNTTFYEDALKPVSKEIGKTLGTLGKTINLVLSPFALSVWGFEKIKDYLIEQLEEKLKNVDEKDIIGPNPHVAGPLIEAMRFTGDNEELREMFANLLANSMDKNTASKAHPAYVDIIKNITSDEAKLIKYFSKNTEIAALEMICYVKEKQFEVIARNIVKIDNSHDYVNFEMMSSYIDNLCRMGLLEVPFNRGVSDENKYKIIEELPVIDEYKDSVKDTLGTNIGFIKALIRLTDFGGHFVEICVNDKN